MSDFTDKIILVIILGIVAGILIFIFGIDIGENIPADAIKI
ncbi:MAG: hypothetical protein ACOCP5_00005 [Halanaerobiaceae bacterium]